ncbi:MAG: hypothetical protein RBU29_06535 [bacterium]|jgi:hypothetical protein|nr:hypothetical protein [bacterium]
MSDWYGKVVNIEEMKNIFEQISILVGWTMKPDTVNKAKFLILATITIVTLSFAAIWIFQLATGQKPYYQPWSYRSQAEIETKCKEHITVAEAQVAEVLKRRTNEFCEFIQARKEGAQPFSKDLISWYGKWRAVKPYLPFAKDEGHTEYVTEKFNQHIFSKEELAEAMTRAIMACIKDLESVENHLAAELRQEIMGQSIPPDQIPIAEKEFSQVMEQLVAASQWDAAKTVGNLAASEIVSYVATHVMIHLGVSLGILTAGAVNSTWTFGISTLIGLIVDVIWEWIDDPAGDIEREMKKALDQLSNDASQALYDELQQVATQRSQLWNQAVTEMLP